MELTDLRYFLNVAACESFVRAADVSHVTPPAISKTIKKLESELDTKLFVRTTRRVRLTEAGKILRTRCLRVFGELETLRHELDEASSTVRGELRIAAMEVFSTYLLPTAICDLVREHPQLSPRCHEMIPQRMEQLVVDGRIDVGFTIGGGSVKGITYESLGQTPGMLVCGERHPLFERGRVSKKALLEHPSVVPRFFELEHLPSLDQFPEGIDRRIGATIELLQMGIQLAIQGGYIGYFPEVSVRPYLEDGSLKALKGLRAGPPFALHALTRADLPQKAATSLLIALISRTVRASL
jgi:DNA-binding transcriptional LysR family regulator